MEEKLIGRIPTINIKARTIAEGFYKAIIACYDQGIRIETPKHHPGGSLGYDAHITVEVTHPYEEPLICTGGLADTDLGIMQYILEVTHGIHNHWKKDPNNPNDTNWGYTYNERFAPQIPFVLQRIKKDFEEKGRISGRDYYFIIWDPKQDVIKEQEDPPCWQNGQLRFVKGEDGNTYLNYLTMWRSRDLTKAWNENNIAQSRLQILLAKKISNVLGMEIKVGSYIDTSDSLHIYGLYLDQNRYDKHIQRMKKEGFDKFTMTLEQYFCGKETKLKRIVGAQEDAEKKKLCGRKASEDQLIELGYNLDTFEYPKDWDTWPKEWDEVPDKNKLF
ncbi:MAG: hypothetical protein PHD81_00875 [Candidatus Nanoarchaeia archaeon]|nr:hypothetical protein [Candidatus Nanoarchaeia archaeon]MDD5587643.1 hypothetical protein [Candidatus Nanoarchaeia archaeon]